MCIECRRAFCRSYGDAMLASESEDVQAMGRLFVDIMPPDDSVPESERTFKTTLTLVREQDEHTLATTMKAAQYFQQIGRIIEGMATLVAVEQGLVEVQGAVEVNPSTGEARPVSGEEARETMTASLREALGDEDVPGALKAIRELLSGGGASGADN